MLTGPSPEVELQIAVKKILAWVQIGLKPSEIAVLYRANTQGWVKHLASLISQQTPVYWPQEGNGSFSDPSGVCVRTMHSAKGLQWRAVLVARCDMMPFMPEPNIDRVEQERLERGLMYVAMTRAEEMLAFTRSSLNGFASHIQQLLDHGSVRKQ
jgi:superfamily I DNA/RNA helicase